jgi:hypothetical protein
MRRRRRSRDTIYILFLKHKKIFLINKNSFYVHKKNNDTAGRREFHSQSKFVLRRFRVRAD